ncbi:hypothetical protein FRC06_011751 [Ceratobasidium sp. 370]|nr:hypothetical protein FRC06_011751 [Ceratobasidium sp. 370]
MSNNTHSEPVHDVREPTADASGDTGDTEHVNSEPLDGSDFSWLKTDDPVAVINDPKLDAHCLHVVKYLQQHKIHFGHFIWAVNYGNKASRGHKAMQTARSQFRGEYLIPTLHYLRAPPRTESKGAPPPNAKDKIDWFILAMAGQRLREEMKDFVHDVSSMKPEAFSERDFLQSVNYDDLQSQVHFLCPTIFILLYMLSTCVFRNHRWGSNNSNANFFVVMMIACMAYQLSSANNTMQRLLGYYFKAKHVPKAVVGMLSNINLCMSYSSTTKTLDKLAKSIRKSMLDAVQKFPILLVHDNLRIRHAVRSQRSDNQTVTDNGTAMTVIILPESSRDAWENPEAARQLQSHLDNLRTQGTPPKIIFGDLVSQERQARVQAHKLFHLFDILLAIPGFKQLAILSDPALKCPPGWHDLLASPDSITRQYILGTCPIDELSYTGNLMVIQEVLRQLGLDSGKELMQLALGRKVPWVGDELTVSRLRALQWQRQEENNAYDRLDPFIFLFGWFHTLMILASSIFENHRGSMAGLGFDHIAQVLSRTGFSENMRQTRPDYHSVKEILMHEFESRVRDYWLWVTNTKSLEELKSWLEDPTHTTRDVLEAGRKIQRERISKQAISLYELEAGGSVETFDQVFLESLIQTRDLELFWDLRHAVKHGKVGHMEDLIPELLVFFTGGRHSNYARQMYETLQILFHESTPAIRHAIRENCWLVNMSGRKDGFYAVDLRQELNNGAIREYGPPPQGKASWDDYAKASVLIPMYADIVQHVEGSITGIQRSHIHKNPPWERDLEILMQDHTKTKALVIVPGREVASPADRSKDYFKSGLATLQDTDALDKYAEQRQ